MSGGDGANHIAGGESGDHCRVCYYTSTAASTTGSTTLTAPSARPKAHFGIEFISAQATSVHIAVLELTKMWEAMPNRNREPALEYGDAVLELLPDE